MNGFNTTIDFFFLFAFLDPVLTIAKIVANCFKYKKIVKTLLKTSLVGLFC